MNQICYFNWYWAQSQNTIQIYECSWMITKHDEKYSINQIAIEKKVESFCCQTNFYSWFHIFVACEQNKEKHKICVWWMCLCCIYFLLWYFKADQSITSHRYHVFSAKKKTFKFMQKDLECKKWQLIENRMRKN